MNSQTTFNPNSNHPVKGSSIKVEPIRDLKAIKRIKAILADQPRDLCLFTMGINTAYRANELLSLSVDQVDYLRAGDRLDLKQTKNEKYRPVTLNAAVVTALDAWVKVHPVPNAGEPLFVSKRGGEPVQVSTFSRMVKQWCADVGLKGNYASHTLRKTWGYHQRVTYGVATALLTRAYGHASEAQTLDYLCIQPEEIDELYAQEL